MEVMLMIEKQVELSSAKLRANSLCLIREAFQSKKTPNLGINQNRGGVVKKSKKSQISVGNSSKLGGGLRKSKKSQVSESTKD